MEHLTKNPEIDRQTDRDRGPGCHDSTDLGVIQSKATVDGECLKRLLVIAIKCTRQFVHHLHHPDHTETHLSVTICTTPIALKHIYQSPSAPLRSHWNTSISHHLHETYLSMAICTTLSLTICTTLNTLKHIYQWPSAPSCPWPSAPPRSHWNTSINGHLHLPVHNHLHHPDHTETIDAYIIRELIYCLPQNVTIRLPLITVHYPPPINQFSLSPINPFSLSVSY